MIITFEITGRTSAQVQAEAYATAAKFFELPALSEDGTVNWRITDFRARSFLETSEGIELWKASVEVQS